MDSMVHFLYRTNWRRLVDKKLVRNAKSRTFMGKNRRRYWYWLSGTGTRMQWAIGTGTAQTCTGIDWQWVTSTGTGQSGTGTTTSSSPVLTYFFTVKSRIRIPMFRDPKK